MGFLLNSKHGDAWRQVLAWLDAGGHESDGPAEFDMRTWCDRKPQPHLFEVYGKSPDCGSIMCIGGALEAITGVSPKYNWQEFGLTEWDVDRLFYNPHRMYATAAEAAATIHRLDKIGEVRWEVANNEF